MRKIIIILVLLFSIKLTAQRTYTHNSRVRVKNTSVSANTDNLVTIDANGLLNRSSITLNTVLAGEANVQSNWDETDTNSDAFIQNKPTLNFLSLTGGTLTGSLNISGTVGDKLMFERTGYDTYAFQQSPGLGLNLRNVTDNESVMFFNGNGAIGINTTTPNGILDIRSNTPSLAFTDANNSNRVATIIPVSDLSENRAYTLPNSSGILALNSRDNNFTTSQTINGNVISTGNFNNSTTTSGQIIQRGDDTNTNIQYNSNNWRIMSGSNNNTSLNINENGTVSAPQMSNTEVSSSLDNLTTLRYINSNFLRIFGNLSLSLGSNISSTNVRSISVGEDIVVTGSRTSTFGNGLINKSFAETAIGTYNTDYTVSSAVNSPNSFFLSDRVFSVGIGSSDSNRKNALTIVKTGKATFSDVIRLTPLSSAPSSPEKGDIYFDDTTNKLRCYDGTSWQDLF